MDIFKRKKKNRKAKLDDYEVIGEIKYDTTSVIYKKIQRKTDRKVFIWNEIKYKMMTVTEKASLILQVELLKHLEHPYVVRFVDYIDDEQTFTLYIIREYFINSILSLINNCKKNGSHLDEIFIWKMLYQLLSILDECHKFNRENQTIINHCLEPAYVFLDSQWNVKFGGFSLGQQWGFARIHHGMISYISPEQLSLAYCSEKSSVWSLGCLLYELCSLIPPFTGSNWFQMTIRIKDGVFHRIPWRYSDELQNVISSMLTVKEDSRPSFKTLQTHPRINTFTTKNFEEHEIPPSVSAKIKDNVKFDLLEAPVATSNNIKESSKSGKKTVIVYRKQEQNGTDDVKEYEKRLQDKIKYFESQLERAEKVLEKIGNYNSMSLSQKRPRSLDRTVKTKRHVQFMANAKENKENLSTEHKVHSLASDFEKRKTELEKRLKDAQEHALKLRSEEINSRFSTCVSFV